MKNFIYSILFLLISNFVFATNYYVSNTGNDNNNGTTATTPWKTLAKVNAGHYVGGDQLFFKGGQTFTGTIALTVNNVSNNLGCNVTLNSFGSGNAIIKAGNGNGVDVTNIAGITIFNLIIKGGWNPATQSGNDGAGINFLYG